MRLPEQEVDRSAIKQELQQAIGRDRRAILIVNTRSRRGARSYSLAKEALARAGLRLVAAYPVRHAERLPQIVEEEVARGAKFIIVGGGDGTISSVVEHFAHVNVVLGILPLGTANDFARTMGIPVQLGRAVEVLATGKVADVDLGLANGNYFANGVSIGLVAVTGRATPAWLKRWLGRAAYGLVGLKKFARFAFFRCTVSAQGSRSSFDALDVRIASGGYHGGVLVAPDADPDDGKVIVHLLKGRSKRILVRNWLRIARRSRPTGDIAVIKASEVEIHTRPEQPVSVDGEAVTRTPVRLSIDRESLLLMVPAHHRETEELIGKDDCSTKS